MAPWDMLGWHQQGWGWLESMGSEGFSILNNSMIPEYCPSPAQPQSGEQIPWEGLGRPRAAPRSVQTLPQPNLGETNPSKPPPSPSPDLQLSFNHPATKTRTEPQLWNGSWGKLQGKAQESSLLDTFKNNNKNVLQVFSRVEDQHKLQDSRSAFPHICSGVSNLSEIYFHLDRTGKNLGSEPTTRTTKTPPFCPKNIPNSASPAQIPCTSHSPRTSCAIHISLGVGWKKT